MLCRLMAELITQKKYTVLNNTALFKKRAFMLLVIYKQSAQDVRLDLRLTDFVICPLILKVLNNSLLTSQPPGLTPHPVIPSKKTSS